jgi:predicted nucleic acid-binding Zn ribbon protein
VNSSDESDRTAETTSSQPAWDEDGTQLAEALVNRSRAAHRPDGVRQPPPRPTRARQAPGAGWSGPARDDRDPQPLDAAVERLVDERGWRHELAVHGVIARWQEVVGADVAAHVHVERYADGIVTVRADSTAWATQMRLLAATVVRRFNEETEDGTVSKVIIRGPHSPSWRKGPRTVPGRGPRDTYG